MHPVPCLFVPILLDISCSSEQVVCLTGFCPFYLDPGCLGTPMPHHDCAITVWHTASIARCGHATYCNMLTLAACWTLLLLLLGPYIHFTLQPLTGEPSGLQTLLTTFPGFYSHLDTVTGRKHPKTENCRFWTVLAGLRRLERCQTTTTTYRAPYCWLPLTPRLGTLPPWRPIPRDLPLDNLVDVEHTYEDLERVLTHTCSTTPPFDLFVSRCRVPTCILLPHLSLVHLPNLERTTLFIPGGSALVLFPVGWRFGMDDSLLPRQHPTLTLFGHFAATAVYPQPPLPSYQPWTFGYYGSDCSQHSTFVWTLCLAIFCSYPFVWHYYATLLTFCSSQDPGWGTIRPWLQRPRPSTMPITPAT